MSDDVMNEIMRSLGRIEQKIDGHSTWMEQHVADDKVMAEDIKRLQMSGARQRGVLAALATVGTVVGSVAGYAIELFTRGHS